ncbi:hypothetical protein WA026_005683 [Henosepilachna vigintioctopunctata]|uniref:Uncharacterized protein n=1 Tax=Henosepilachna vigintioctopunctata TaxID=420089 RepID=A0AAW1U2H1_9CUCU
MSRSVLSLFKRMASTSKIPQVADVDIDAKGVFKYILIKVTSPNANGEIEDKLIVRGYAECPYHVTNVMWYFVNE